MGTFANDTAVTDLGDGAFRATVLPDFGVIGGAPNGGYLMVLAARAMAITADRPDPVTVTAHFLKPLTPGDVDITTRLVKPGGRHATVTATLAQDGRSCVELLGTFTDLSRADGPSDVRIDAPDWPAPEDLPDLQEHFRAQTEDAFPPPPIFSRLEQRTFPASWGWAAGQPDGTGRVRSWCRLPDDEPMDAIALLFVADALPPAVFNLGADLGWVPTIELTVHVRRRPPADWVAARFRTRAVTDGYLEEDGEIWSRDGHLLVVSRQSALAARG